MVTTCHVQDADKLLTVHYFYQILTNIWMRRQNSSTQNFVKICSAVLQLVRRHGGDNRCIWNISLQLHKKVGDNNRFTVTFSSRIADVTVRVLIYIASCLQIVYTLLQIPFKCRKTSILFGKSTYDVEQWFAKFASRIPPDPLSVSRGSVVTFL
jgi:hypothetical protein